jgi:5-methylcytosine-specific restriction endonuclease McrA
MNIMDTPVLVLNKAWLPIHLVAAREAFNDVLSERARFIDPDTYILHTMEEWMELPKIGVRINDDGVEEMVTYPVVHTVKREIRLPRIMILNDYDEVPDFELNLNTKNIALRDHYCCQYCGKKLRADDVTLDHVLPQSRGGPDTWENLVTSCKKCNLKKANRTPKEAGMTLLSQPRKPKWYPLTARMGQNAPEEWGKFVKNFHERPSVYI